jgi:hypothetical protein
MSSHLRHCPKHRKPRPCAHCALKPAATPESPVAPNPTVLEPMTSTTVPSDPAPDEISRMEAQARDSLGLSTDDLLFNGNKWSVAPPAPAAARFPSIRKTLMLQPEDLIALFDESPATKIGEHEVFEQVDFLVPPEMLQHRIKRLQKVIAASKAIIEGLSVRVMKLRRGKDNILDKATREKFKREKQALMAHCNAKLFRYRTALRSGNYREKIWCYQTKPVYFHEVVDDCMTFTEYGEAYYARDEDRTPYGVGYKLTNLVRDIIATRIFDVSRYEVMTGLDNSALYLMGVSEEEQKRTWANVHRWENCVIKAAVFHGVLRPRPDLVELLGLMPFVQAALAATESEIEADETENALALKTGGACYGGSIHTAGFRFRNGSYRRRSLESFDKSKPPAAGDEGAAEWGRDKGSDLYNLSDHTDSYDPR